ncbi:MAG TPA: DUF177 domain-containing protein [Aestuariivirgaceae bacterium]|nr:DUF177 domain-containing protein [Aestuariivirgaceae bacterium]
MAPEFSRPLAVERIASTGTEVTIEASADEREALARRFDIPAVHAFSATFLATPWRRGGVQLRGEFAARVEQVSVVSLEPFTSEVGEPVTRYFQAETGPGHHPDVLSVESLEDDEPDVISGGSIDLGEIAAESLALALDPYPRKPGEAFEPETAQEAEKRRQDNPFAVLARLKRQ